MATLTPEIPMVNAGLLYINGLQLSNSTVSANTWFNVAAGACRDHTNVNDIVISNNVVVDVAKVGVAGIDTGAVAASSLYAVYAIGSSANQIGNGQPYSAYPGSVIISASFVKPALPYGYDMYRRIGTVATTSGSTLRPFTQYGSGATRTMWYNAPLATSITAGNSTVYDQVELNFVTGAVPAQVCTVILDVILTPATAGNTVYLSATGTGPSDYASFTAPVAAVSSNNMLFCPSTVIGGVADLFYKVSNASDLALISVRGFEDNL